MRYKSNIFSVLLTIGIVLSFILMYIIPTYSNTGRNVPIQHEFLIGYADRLYNATDTRALVFYNGREASYNLTVPENVVTIWFYISWWPGYERVDHYDRYTYHLKLLPPAARDNAFCMPDSEAQGFIDLKDGSNGTSLKCALNYLPMNRTIKAWNPGMANDQVTKGTYGQGVWNYSLSIIWEYPFSGMRCGHQPNLRFAVIIVMERYEPSIMMVG